MKPFIDPAIEDQAIKEHMANMRLRHAALQIAASRIDFSVLQCELAVDRAFARAGYEAKA
jgi:hypothetical protein